MSTALLAASIMAEECRTWVSLLPWCSTDRSHTTRSVAITMLGDIQALDERIALWRNKHWLRRRSSHGRTVKHKESYAPISRPYFTGSRGATTVTIEDSSEHRPTLRTGHGEFICVFTDDMLREFSFGADGRVARLA